MRESMKLSVLVTLGCSAAILIAHLSRCETATAQPPTTPFSVPAARADPASATCDLPRLRPLVIPVPGVTPSQLHDSFAEMRGNARHEAIDIPAPRGTPVATRFQKFCFGAGMLALLVASDYPIHDLGERYLFGQAA